MSEDDERAAMRALQDWDAGDRNAASEDVYLAPAVAYTDWHAAEVLRQDPASAELLDRVRPRGIEQHRNNPGFRAAVDAARAPLLARIAELEAERDEVLSQLSAAIRQRDAAMERIL